MPHHFKIAQENRERMIEQGLSPEIVRKYLLRTDELQRDNFESVRHSLSRRDQEEIETMLLQGELLLQLVTACCEVGQSSS